MILQQLTLQNFGLYAGEQTLDLTPLQRRGRSAPVVLFGGMNGGGKTTLLDAVQLVLYGSRARCSKRAEKAYDQFLRESIHHGADLNDGAAIELSFRYASEGEEHLYTVTRAWSVQRDRLREKVRVARDGVQDGWLSDNWNQLVEELIPLGIAQLCFFDAEKIRFLAEEETSMQALGDAIKSLLGLDLAERLVADAAVLESRVAKRAKSSAELTEVRELEANLEAVQMRIDELVREQAALSDPCERARARVEAIEEQFARVGGRHWEARESLTQRRGELQQSLRDAESRLVALAATDLPLVLVPELLARVHRQATAECEAAESEVVTQLLADRDAALLTLLEENGADAATIAAAAGFLAGDRERRSRTQGTEPRLCLSVSARQLLAHFLQRGQYERQAAAREQLEQLENVRRALEEAQRSLAATPDETTIAAVMEELKAASAELAGYEVQIRRVEKQLAPLRAERAQLDKQLAGRRRRIVDEQLRSEEDARVGRLLVRTQATMQEYLRQATQRKIDRLSQLISESFRFLLRKQTLVDRVSIDPQSFAVSLYDDTGRGISKQRLSEGEKQIFAVSVLWGLSQAAARPLPAIIDTPMARLDGKHRDKLVERYFPHASHQVIVLSTDTEIERRYFHDLQPHIARAYHLNYDDQRRATTVEEGYFWESLPS